MNHCKPVTKPAPADNLYEMLGKIEAAYVSSIRPALFDLKGIFD